MAKSPNETLIDFIFSGSSLPAKIIDWVRPSFRVYTIGNAAVLLFGILNLPDNPNIFIAQTICSKTLRRKVFAVLRSIRALYSGFLTINNTIQSEIKDDLQLALPPVKV